MGRRQGLVTLPATVLGELYQAGGNIFFWMDCGCPRVLGKMLGMNIINQREIIKRMGEAGLLAPERLRELVAAPVFVWPLPEKARERSAEEMEFIRHRLFLWKGLDITIRPKFAVGASPFHKSSVIGSSRVS